MSSATAVLAEDVDLVIGDLEQEIPLAGEPESVEMHRTCRGVYCI